MSSRIASRILDGSADPLPPGSLVLAGYVVIVAAVLALVSIGGWFGVVATAVVLLAVVLVIVRAGNWPAAPSDTDTDTSAESTPP
jgi:hypothetical protein